MKRIVVTDVSKTFEIGTKTNQTILGKAIALVCERVPQKPLCALRNVSFSIGGGEMVGIVGQNGGGKSTLLRIIAGVMREDSGEVYTDGKIVALLGLDAAICERLTMRDNIFLVCAFLRLSDEEIRLKFNAVVAFAELEEFVDTKWYQFSSGMKQRVIVSIALHADADILLMDEIFASGDEQFRHKSMERLHKLAKQGVAVVLVGHGLSSIKKHCSRVIWIEKGRIRQEGSGTEIIEAYRAHTAPKKYIAPPVPILSEEEVREKLIGNTLEDKKWIEYYDLDGSIRGVMKTARWWTYGGFWRQSGSVFCFYYPNNSNSYMCTTISVDNDTVFRYNLDGTLRRVDGSKLLLGNPYNL